MVAVPLTLGATLLSWTCFLLYIEQCWPRSKGTVISKEEKHLGSDSPFVFYTFRYKSDRGVFEGKPVYSHISNAYNIGETLNLIITPWNHRRFYISLNRISFSVYFAVSISLFAVAAIIYSSKT